eukprot:Em0023g451a
MGNCNSASICSAQQGRAPLGQITVLLLGLDKGGKTTVVANLNNDLTESVTPTIGFSSTAVRIGRFEVSLFDIGGGSQIRGIWERYYAQAHGIIFVVDATAVERLGEVRESLQGVIQDPRVTGKPVLILANKQDQSGAVDECELQNRLDLSTLLGDKMNTVHVVKSTALGNKGQARTSLRGAVLWLLDTVDGRYSEISERVKVDTEEKRAQEAREKQERAERVRLIREERERQAAQGREETDGAACQEDQSNPFRPVEEVIKTIEDRVKKSKAAANATTSGEANTSKVLDTSIQAMGQCGPLVGEPGPPVDEQTPMKVMDESEVEEVKSCSSLSNSESLTDVTERVDSQCSIPDAPNETEMRPTPPLTANRSKQVSHGKSKENHDAPRGTTFLSRLKHRNRTAPAPEPDSGMTALKEKPPPPKLSWVTPLQSGALDQLPELPIQLQSLPPVRMTKALPGMQQRSFLLAEDIMDVPHSTIRVLPPLAS